MKILSTALIWHRNWILQNFMGVLSKINISLYNLYTTESLKILVLTREKDFLEDPVTQLQILVVICRNLLQLEFSVLSCWCSYFVLLQMSLISVGQRCCYHHTQYLFLILCLQVVVAGWPVQVMRCVTSWRAMVSEAFCKRCRKDVWKDVGLQNL